MKSRNRAAFRLCTRSKAINGLAFTGHGPRLVVHEARGITLVYDLATREPVPELVQTKARLAPEDATPDCPTTTPAYCGLRK